MRRRPLAGRRIAVTRPAAQARSLLAALRECGAEPLACPTIRIDEAPDSGLLREAVEGLQEYDWLVFTSTNGVARFWRCLRQLGGDARRLAGLQVAAIGPATASSLRRRGIRPDLVPDEYVAEAVAEALVATDGLSGTRVLLPRAAGARAVLPDRLEEAGAEVHEVVAYTSRADEVGIDRLRTEITEGRLDMITFTASSTVRSFVEVAGPAIGSAAVATIGPITASTARSLGLRVDVVASEYTVPGLVRSICEFYRADDR